MAERKIVMFKVGNSFINKGIYTSREDIFNDGYIYRWENKNGTFAVEKENIIYTVKCIIK